MALKHLLNDEETTVTYPAHHSHLGWEELEIPYDPVPSLPDQSWDHYVGELFGSQSLQSELAQYPDEVDVGYESLQYAQGQIEQWATDHISPQNANLETPCEQVYICYGTIFRASVKLCGNMVDLDHRLSSVAHSPIQGHLQMKLVKVETQFLIAFLDGTALGEVNAQLEKALIDINEQQYPLDFEVFAPVRATRETIGRATKEKDAIVRVQVNVYGPLSIAQSIGKELSQQKIYLQRPVYVRDGTTYDNPHVLTLAGFRGLRAEIALHVEEEKSGKAGVETLEKTIADVYSSLTRGQNLRGLEGDERLKTSLLLHQKTALDFMMQRENGPIPDEYTLWKLTEKDEMPCYRHAVTNTISRLEQTETGGGILADEMGMGKSLSVLALVLRTLDAAHQWATQLDTAASETMRESWISRQRSGGTLIVASSDLMINEWFQELEKHFEEPTRKSLTTIKYHGQHRECSPKKLCGADIVITTYHTLASDFLGSKNPLGGIEWYRLVLDEAHIIRRQSTVLYRTVSEIMARSRWCLTGTPIQNRLEDIGSLFAFLRLNPFHSLSTFRKYIALPFDEGDKRRQLAVERFTRLLDSFCLRRTKDLLHLPDQQTRIRNIVLSPEERTQYDQTQNIMFRAVRNQVGCFDQKSTLGMFQVQLQLRILCNHGTWQQPFSWNRRKLHLLDEREAMEASLGKEGEVTCSACRQTMPLFNAGSMFRRYTEHCRHVLCSECLEQSMPTGQENLPTNCPLCTSLWAVPTQTPCSKHASQEDMYFRAEGRSSKMETLMKDVLEDILTTKSIIFTSWTRTLDLLEFYLGKASLESRNFKRIDGDCPTAKRERILHEFTNSPQLRILIMTTGTGAVGLNLATANRVFIVEPQWNPSVENQAIARALRLGQKQPVLVTRYVVDQTVELDMQALQNTKLERANLVKSG